VHTFNELAAALAYNSETGVIAWRVSRGNLRNGNSCVKSGDRAGWLAHNGYRIIEFDGARYQTHRLAWLFSFGMWPGHDLDHINGIRDDNRITNLREATRSQNNGNSKLSRRNSSGLKGVSPDPRGGFRAQIAKDGVRKFLGRFASVDEAHAAYVRAAQRQWGEFARTT
jgi:hypothetical protein